MGPSFAMLYRAVVAAGLAAGATAALYQASEWDFFSAWPAGVLLLLALLSIPSATALVAALPEPRWQTFGLNVIGASIAMSVVFAIGFARGDHPDYTDGAIRGAAIGLGIVGVLLMTLLGWAAGGVVLGVRAWRRHRAV